MMGVSGGLSSVIFRLREVSQQYCRPETASVVLDGVDFTLMQGDTCSIVGASGSGKSTLLNILGLLEKPYAGNVQFMGQDVMAASLDELAIWRNQHLGFVFQAFNLLPRLSALDNVALPLIYRSVSRQKARLIAARQLERVGLEHRAQHRPADLSGGQRQRVAIARALVGKPSLLLADEPTGNLDQHCANEIIELLLTLNRQRQLTLVTVTHDLDLAARFARRLKVEDGKLLEQVRHDAA